MKKIRSLLVLMVILSVIGCTTKPDTTADVPAAYNIVGKWEYTLKVPDGNVYDDGTIEFAGTPNQGNWTLLNFYNVEYEGNYTVNGNMISLTGDETWQGSFVDDTHMNGQWKNDEANGEWTAIKK